MSIALPVLLLVQAAITADAPSTVVRQASRAVESGDVASATARWQATLARDSADLSARLGLATIARLTYDLATAERHYAAIATASKASLRYRAWVALGRAQPRLFRDPFDSAAASLTAAASLASAANDSTAVAEALFGLAQAQVRTASAPASLATVDSALRIIPAGDMGLRAEGRCVRAVVLWTLGRAKFGDEAEAGLALARAAGDRRRQAMCLVFVGVHRLTTGRDAEASALLDSAVAIAQEGHDRSLGALALWWRGNHHLELYEHDGAQRTLSSALIEAEASGNRFIAGWAWIRLSVVSWHFADMMSARRDLARGRDIIRALGDGWGTAYSRGLEGAMALDGGQLDTAEAAFRDDLDWALHVKQPLEQFTATFGLARVAVSRGEWQGARARFDDAMRVARTHGLDGYVPQLQYEYGLIALKEGDLAEAERRFRTMLASSSLSDLDRYAARSRIAEIDVARGNLERAERELTEATDAIDSLRAALNDKDLRVLAFQAHKGHDDVDLGFATVIAGLTAGGRIDAALELTERRRARELRDRLVRGSAHLTRDLGTGARRFADDRTVVLEYVTGSGSQPTTMFVLSSRGTRAFQRPPADSMAPDIAAFASLVEAGAGASALARQLGQAVFGSVLDSLPADVSRLIIVGDGPLQRLPFDALRMRDGRYVIERFAVSVAPSVAVAADLRSRSRDNAGSTRILAFGDPQFANEAAMGGSAADTYRDAFSMNGGLPRLLGSATEARLVARFASLSELRLRERASESYLKHAALDSFDVIHLATHALIDERSVARTALAVAGGDGEDGFVGPGELSALRLDARLVVLSACRTAQGVAVRGEGVQGLTAPLLASGARSVLATQWRIRDADAVQFIDDFYRALAAGRTVSDAARAAKLAAIARGATPATWAAFSVVGDPLVTVPLRVPSDGTRQLVFAIGIVVTLGVLYGVVTRTRRAADRSSVPSERRADTVQ